MRVRREDEKKEAKEHWVEKYGKGISIDLIIGIVILVIAGSGLVKCSSA